MPDTILHNVLTSTDLHEPKPHKAKHQNSGVDEIDVTGLSGVLADQQDAGKIKSITVDITALADNRVIAYNLASNKWVCKNIISTVAPTKHSMSFVVANPLIKTFDTGASFIADSEDVTLNGLSLIRGAGNDYTITGTAVVLTAAVTLGINDQVMVKYSL